MNVVFNLFEDTRSRFDVELRIEERTRELGTG